MLSKNAAAKALAVSLALITSGLTAPAGQAASTPAPASDPADGRLSAEQFAGLFDRLCVRTRGNPVAVRAAGRLEGVYKAPRQFNDLMRQEADSLAGMQMFLKVVDEGFLMVFTGTVVDDRSGDLPMDTCMVAIMPPTDRDDVVAEVGRLMGVNFERDEQGKLLSVFREDPRGQRTVINNASERDYRRAAREGSLRIVGMETDGEMTMLAYILARPRT